MTSQDFSAALRPEGEGAVCIDVYCNPDCASACIGPFDPWRRRFHVSVSAPAVGGRANRELGQVMGDALGVPPSNVTILRGATTRRKTLKVDGIGIEDASAALDRVLG